MAEVNSSISVITLNVNWLNSPIIRQRLGLKKETIYTLSTRDSLQIKGHKEVESKRM